MSDSKPPMPEVKSQADDPDVVPFPSISNEIAIFLRDADAIADTLPIVMTAVGAASTIADRHYLEFLEQHGNLERETEDTKYFHVPTQFYPEVVALRREHHSTQTGRRMLPRVYVVALVAMFDAFLGRLIKCLFYIKPETLSASERNLTFAQLAEFDSIDAAKEFVVEKEIESVLRSSHAEQFDWLERRFDVALRKDLAAWPIFIELTERRNLFVHTAGVVSTQYLGTCRKHGVSLPENLKAGDQLGVSREYFNSAYHCIVEIAVKLAQVLWRKLKPDALADADSSLIATTYDLLVIAEYELVTTLLQFGCFTLKRHSSDENKRILLINLAQARKWTGHQDTCLEILAREDWSSSSDKFRIGVAVLRDDFQEASQIMRRMGAKGAVAEADYAAWPLFQEFRKTREFADSYQAVFHKSFQTTAEVSPEESQETADRELPPSPG